MTGTLSSRLAEKIKQIKKEVEFQFMRSSGPGGQNVNKTNSAVQLRWSIDQSGALQLEEKELVKRKLAHLLTTEGELLIKSTESRDQKQNIETSYQKLEALIIKAFTRVKARIKTKPTRGSKERRLTSKKMTGAKKEQRRSPKNNDH